MKRKKLIRIGLILAMTGFLAGGGMVLYLFNMPHRDTQKAKITNNGDIDYKKDGTYSATVAGELTIKGVTKPVNERGTVVVKGGLVNVQSVFKVMLADYGVTFLKGKPSTNIAKEVEVTVHAEYKSE